MSDNGSSLVQVTAGGVCWQVRPEHREQLLGPEGLRLGQWLRNGQAQVVKNGPHRIVYRVALPGLIFYLKHYRLHDTRAWLRELVRPSKARMEHDRSLAVIDRQLPTAVPLALGECGSGRPGDSFLITQSLEGTEPLSTFIEQRLPQFAPKRLARVRQRLAEELGRLLARMHDRGIVHNDLHAGNLLVRLDADDRPGLYLIDLHAVTLRRSLGWRASRANLVLLNRWFVLRVSRTDRLRFWRAYSLSRGLFTLRETRKEQARDLERRTWASNLRFWKHRDDRCLDTNRYYRHVRSGGVAGHAVTDLGQAALAPLLADPDEPFRRPGVRLLKDSPSSTVAELELAVNGQPRRVIYKRFRVTAWSDPLTALMRRPAALRSWIFGHGLRERGLPTARPLAVLHRQRRGLVYEGYLLTEKIPDAVDLRRFLDGLGNLDSNQGRACLHRLIDQLARLVRQLHRRQLSHRDLKAANVLVGGDPSAPVLWLIDLVGVQRYHRPSRRRMVQDLARLHASFCGYPGLTRTDRLRFLRVYQQWGLFGRYRWKPWWRRIERATLAKVAKNARSGRPLA